MSDALYPQPPVPPQARVSLLSAKYNQRVPKQSPHAFPTASPTHVTLNPRESSFHGQTPQPESNPGTMSHGFLGRGYGDQQHAIGSGVGYITDHHAACWASRLSK
ncbi:hypothetical protein VUR80DRAFT_2844 [Thermomyces stellatus]